MANENEENNAVTQTQDTQQLPVRVSRYHGKVYEGAAWGESQFHKVITKIKGNGEKEQDAIHEAAMQALIVAMDSKKNNYDWATQLVAAVEESVASGAAFQLRKWFLAHGPYRWMQKEKKFRKSNSENAVPFNPKDAYEKPYYSFAKRELQVAEAIMEAISSDTIIARVSRLLSSLNGMLDDISKGKATVENKDVDLPVLEHIRSSLFNIEVGAKREKETLVEKIKDQEFEKEQESKVA